MPQSANAFGPISSTESGMMMDSIEQPLNAPLPIERTLTPLIFDGIVKGFHVVVQISSNFTFYLSKIRHSASSTNTFIRITP